MRSDVIRHSDCVRQRVDVSIGRTELPVSMVWYGMVEVCEGAPVAVSGWVLADRHDLRPCAASVVCIGEPYPLVI